MNDNELRQAILSFQKRFGSSITFIATTCGVSREHLSRWLHHESYVILDQIKTKIRMIIKGAIPVMK